MCHHFREDLTDEEIEEAHEDADEFTDEGEHLVTAVED